VNSIETETYIWLNAESKSNIIVIGDHAGDRFPETLDTHLLGLDPTILDVEAVERHIVADVGVDGLCRALAMLLGAPTLMSRFSRLVVDLNRYPEDVAVIPPRSDGVDIPGNAMLSGEARKRRLECYFEPYHQTLRSSLAEYDRLAADPLILLIHSFTPFLSDGIHRPWDVGVLWRDDERVALPALRYLRAEGDLMVGDNEPYSARGMPVGYSLVEHCERPSRRHLLLEIRQDLLATPAQQRSWAVRVAKMVRALVD
jgi:predicted N-formylglutamate amidohydrolase